MVYATDYRGGGDRRQGQWDILSASLQTEGSTAGVEGLVSIPADEPTTTYVPTPNKNYTTQVRDKVYRVFYGDLHRHTDIRGHGSADVSATDQYRYALDAAELDFMATTDHVMVSGNAWSDGLDEYSWWRTQKNADLYWFPGRFVSLYGYERSYDTPGGHRNIIWPHRRGELIPGDRRIPSDNIPVDLWRRLRTTGGISIPHTLADRMQPKVGWDWHDPERQPVMEMYQGARSSYEFAGASPEESRGFSAESEPGHFLWDALKRGHRIGVIASSDHNSTHLSYACVYAEDFSRESIFEGLQKRRTYAATDNIILDFRIGDTFMGEETSMEEPPTLSVKVIGTFPIRRIDIIKNNQIVYTHRPAEGEAEFSFLDRNTFPGQKSYYYVRVIQMDEMMAWSSPVWVDMQ